MTEAPSPARSFRFNRFELQPGERRLLRDGQPLPLRPLAFDVLTTLVARPQQLVTKDELLQQVWKRVVVEENTLQVHVSALRKLLGAEAIQTVAGQGYRFTPRVQGGALSSAGPAVPPNNLPQGLTRFIGRTQELAQVRRQLEHTRLLMLTGAAGCGKSRLALEAARGALSSYPGGVWLVQLAPLTEPAQLVQAFATALAVPPSPGQALTDAVLDWLRPRRLLLVLDNIEHLIETTAPWADQLLRSCPQLTILATSRERLRVDGELSHGVPPLAVPATDADIDVLGSEAVRLFVDRAQLQRPDFQLQHEEAALVAAICRRLDGMALAIELAAQQLRVMSLQALSRQLDDPLRCLSGGPRTALPRHRTLRSLIAWSYDLLSPKEQAVLRRLAVFDGGWSLEAAEELCIGIGVQRSDVVHLLASLVDKNLVVAQVQGADTRFGMMDNVRHYTLAQLAGPSHQAAAQDASGAVSSCAATTGSRVAKPSLNAL